MTTEGIENVGSAAPVQQEAPKLLDQDTVNKIVGAQKGKAYDQGVNDTLARLAQGLETDTATSATAAKPLPDIQAQIDAAVNRKMQQQQEEHTQKALLEQSTKIVNEVEQKFTQAAQKLEDFDKVIGRINIKQNMTILPYLHSLPNAGEVWYQLAKNPSKLTALMADIRTTPAGEYSTAALATLQDISESITTNEVAAKTTKFAPEPLARQKSSSLGTSDNKSLTEDELLASFKKRFRN